MSYAEETDEEVRKILQSTKEKLGTADPAAAIALGIFALVKMVGVAAVAVSETADELLEIRINK